MEGAAARAAARAASLGLAAASTGYASLGGVDDHVSADTYLSRGAQAHWLISHRMTVIECMQLLHITFCKASHAVRESQGCQIDCKAGILCFRHVNAWMHGHCDKNL